MSGEIFDFERCVPPLLHKTRGRRRRRWLLRGILQLSCCAVNVKLLIDQMHLFYSFSSWKNYRNMRMGSSSFMIVSAISFMLLRLFWLCRRIIR